METEQKRIVLIENGTSFCAAVIGKNADASERHAAEELAEYLTKIGGAQIPVLTEDDASLPGIPHLLLVGTEKTNGLILKAAGTLWENGIPEKDAFYLRTYGENIVFSGCRNRATLYAVYHFLEKYLNTGFFWDGDSIHPQASVIVDAPDLYEESAFLYRFSRSGSDCNAGYTFTSWWDFDQWKKEIDFMMKNKVNLARVGLGFEAVQMRTWRKLGVPVAPSGEKEEKQLAAAKKVYDYCRLVGLELVNYLPSVNVSDSFYNTFPDGDYYGSIWCTEAEFEEAVKKNPPKPRTLFPDSPVYRKLIVSFLETWRECFDMLDRMFIIQTPCESQITADLTSVLLSSISAPLDALRSVIPEAKIMIDGWNFRFMYNHIWKNGVFAKFLHTVGPDDIVVLDLWPSWPGSTPIYQMEDYREVNYCPFVIAFLNEFGGDNRMQGCYDTLIAEAKRLLTDASASRGSGFGNTSEVMYFNVNYHDLIYHAAWDPRDLWKNAFVENQVMRRYGPELYNDTVGAFKLLVNAVYTGWNTSWGTGYQSRLFMPHTEEKHPEKTPLIVANLRAYLDSALPVPKAGRDNPFLLSDIYEGLRQYLAELSNVHMTFMWKACHEKDKASFHRYAGNMLFLLDQTERLVRSNKRWYIENEVRQREGHVCNLGYGSTAEDIRLYIRDCGTTFAKTEPRLLDYSRKDYYELVKYYYRPRTEAFIDYISSIFNDIVPGEELDMAPLEKQYADIAARWIEVGYPPEEFDLETEPLWSVMEEIYRAVEEI